MNAVSVFRKMVGTAVVLLCVATSGCRTWSTREQKAVEAYNQGNQLREEGRLSDAVSAYRTAIDYQSDLSAAVYNLALSLAELERWPESFELLVSLYEQDPGNLTIIRSLGWLSWKMGNVEDAIGYYRLALDIFEADRESLVSLAGIYEAEGRPEAALEFRRTLLRLNDDVESLSALARVLNSLGSEKDALDNYREVLVREPKNPEALRERARISESLGLYREALASYRDLSEVEPAVNRSHALWRAARILLVDLEEYREGTQMLKETLDSGYSVQDDFDDLIRSVAPTIRPSVRQILSDQEPS